jgi:phenylacetate-coenzyme A ligase PaaK-like adenylate-forming protein
MENWDDAVTDPALHLADVQEFIRDLRDVRMFRDTYYVCSTTGSTGLNGVFVYDREEWCSVLASFARAAEWAGVGVGIAKRVRMAVVSTTTPWHQSAVVGATLRSWFVPTLRLDATAPIGEIVAALNAFRPEALVAYAGTAGLLAAEQSSGRLRISPRAVFCTSEALTDGTRRQIEEAWGVRPVNVYAATETAGIASGRAGLPGLRLYEDLVIVEPVDGSNRPIGIGEHGAKILVTVLFSRTLPLIRYELGDSLRLLPEMTGEWRPFGVIEDVRGSRRTRSA